MDYPFQRACVQPPPSLRKNRRKGVCGEGGDCTQASLRQIIHFSSSVKTINNKIPLSSVFNDSERLYWTTVCRCLVRRPHYSTQLMRFGSRGPSEFATEMPWLRGKTLYRNRHGNVYRSVGEKQGLVVYRQRVYKQWHLCVLFHCCLDGTTSWKSQILIPNMKPHFRYGKN